MPPATSRKVTRPSACTHSGGSGGSQRISSHVRRKLGYEYLYNKHQQLMNEQQRASQLFYRLLYTENPSLLQILKAAPRSQLMVALKVYLLRKIGYDI